MVIREAKHVATRGLKSVFLNGQRRTVDRLWQEFFSDPSQWWDTRQEKVNARYPDFKHKKTQESLWLNGKSNPPWVAEKVAGMEPGTIQVDLFTWNKRLMRHVNAGHHQTTIKVFQQMQQEGMEPNSYSFVPVINACSSLQALEWGRHIHMMIMKYGLESDLFVCNSLIDMYAKCGSIDDAWKVFNDMPIHDVISWNAMILGCVTCGQGDKAWKLYSEMCGNQVEPSPVTFIAVLNACASVAALERGKRIHEQIIDRGWESDLIIGNSLIDMYAKCGSIQDAWSVFSKMATRNVVSWSAMIVGLVKCGQSQTALDLFQKMQEEGVDPDPGTFVAVLNACASIAALEKGKGIHEQIVQRKFDSDIFVGNGLIDMYAKCGNLEAAKRVFYTMPIRNVVSWNAMLGGYAIHGYAEEALKHFEQMWQGGLEMDEITFGSLLSACSHAGLVDEGVHIFESLTIGFGIPVTVEHYSCMVDLLGRAGRLHEGEDLIKGMSCDSNFSLWMSLLGTCRIHGNLETGERVAQLLFELDPENSAGYVVLANLHAAKWHGQTNPQMTKCRDLEK